MMSSEVEMRQKLEEAGCILKDDHFVYVSGKHGRQFFDKDVLFFDPELNFSISLALFDSCKENKLHPQMVVSPSGNVCAFNSRVAGWFKSVQKNGKVLSAYAEESKDGKKRVFRRGFAPKLVSKKVLVLEDVLNTGGTAKKVVEAVRRCGGEVIGLVAVCNRGRVTEADVGDVPKLLSLVNLTMDAWPEDACPLCAKGVPINTTYGHGEKFLRRRRGGIRLDTTYKPDDKLARSTDPDHILMQNATWFNLKGEKRGTGNITGGLLQTWKEGLKPHEALLLLHESDADQAKGINSVSSLCWLIVTAKQVYCVPKYDKNVIKEDTLRDGTPVTGLTRKEAKTLIRQKSRETKK